MSRSKHENLGIGHGIEMVTPTIAAEWLDHNVNNRKIREGVVQRYRSDMLSGRWTFAADPIRFAKDGTLIDGQHRLTALADLVEYEDVALPLLVIRGLPNESQAVMDQGSKRTAGDQLSLRGIKDATFVAAATKQFIGWQDGFLFRDTKVMQTITSAQIEDWVEKNHEDVDFLLSLGTIVKQHDAPPSVAGAAAMAFGRLNADDTREFFKLLARGAGTHGHPIVALDKRLQRHRREGLKMPNRDYLALFVAAWNAWRDGRELTKFQRPRGGAWSDENFPEPK